MVQEPIEATPLPADVVAIAAERDALRAALAEADAVTNDLRRQIRSTSRAKTDFMVRMTHEMRTPLSAIIGLSNLALEETLPPALTDYLSKIRQSAKTLLAVVDDITDFSRLEKGLADLSPAPFDPDRIMERVRSRFIEAAGQKGLAINVRLDPAVPPHLVGDHVRLEQVLGHLVGNAVKFTEKGEVTLSISQCGQKDGVVRLRFSVRDTGIGMVQETIPAMLESFTQGDDSLSRPYGGTGLGLAIVQRSLDLLGGSLQAESTPGRGTCFSFTLDLKEGSPDRPGPPLVAAHDRATCTAPSEAEGPLAGTRLLLVEDNTINQQVAREVLRRFGATVAVARHGGEAVEMVRKNAYDVVLMDVQMPVMDGLAATRAIRALPDRTDLPIVALTAHALDEDRERCLAAGMNDYLTKPIESDRLLATLGQWIAPAALAANRARRTPPPNDASPGETPGLDVANALVRLGGNEKLLRDVAAEFVRDYAESAALLRQALAKGDFEAARRLVHTLKGVSGNISADGLAARARELEQALRQGLPDETLVRAFADALDRTLADAARLDPAGTTDQALPIPNSKRILLVDDSKLNRAILGQILRSAGHEVVPAANGKEACRLLFGDTTRGRPFDCLLMDIEMPEMDGLRAATLIRSLLAASAKPPCSPRIPIVALTFHNAAAEREHCRAAGMDGCLPKVYDRDPLLAGLDRILAGHSQPDRRTASPRKNAARAPLPALVRGLAHHLREGSIHADEDLAALRESVIGQPEPPELVDLAAAIARYDFTAALDCLRRLTDVWGLPPLSATRRSSNKKVDPPHPRRPDNG